MGAACRFYGWTPDYVLKMPASQFFVMLEAARSIRNKERVLDCWVVRSGQVSKEGFLEILEYFDSMDMPKRIPQLPPIPEKPERVLKGQDARAAMIAAFGAYNGQGSRKREMH